MPEITASTPVEEVIKFRPKLVSLAQLVFERTTTGTLRAFTQFQKASDLADLINAKRAGTFDYGVCIRDTDNGAEWPEAQPVLVALMKAKEGKLNTDDMVSLGLKAEDFKKVCPTAVKTEAPPAATEPPAEEAPKRRTRKKAEEATPEQPSQEPTTPSDKVAEPEQTVTPSNNGELLRALAGCFEGLEKSIAGLVSGLAKGNADGLGRVLVVQRGIVGYLETVRNNQQALADGLSNVLMYLDPHAETVALQNMDPQILEDIKTGFGVNNTKLVEPEEKPLPLSQTFAKAAPEPESAPEPEQPAPKVEQVQGETVIYTREHLEDLAKQGEPGLAKLREIAASVGVPKADKIGYSAVAVRKILAMQQPG